MPRHDTKQVLTFSTQLSYTNVNRISNNIYLPQWSDQKATIQLKLNLHDPESYSKQSVIFHKHFNTQIFLSNSHLSRSFITDILIKNNFIE